MADTPIGPGHNRPPITPPAEADYLDDLKTRFPNVEPRFIELSDAFLRAPKSIDDDATAAKVQDLYRTMVEVAGDWDDSRKKEKRPWDKIAKLVQGFFATKTEALEGYAKALRERHTAYAEKKAEAERARQAAELEAQRKEADRLKREADEAEQRRLEAERLAEEARQREEKARLEEEAAKKRKAEADAAAAAAREEEKRLDRERKEREKAEKDQLAVDLREIGKLYREARGLFDDFEQTPEDTWVPPALEHVVQVIARVRADLSHHRLLSEEQRQDLEVYEAGIAKMRVFFQGRTDRKRQIEQEAAEREAAERAEARRQEAERVRKIEEEKLAAARRDREEQEAAAAKAKAEAAAARKEIKAAGEAQDDAMDIARDAASEGSKAAKAAGKTEQRAERMEGRLERATDADMSRTRGEYSVGSLSGRWAWRVTDRDALLATMGTLGVYIAPDAIDAGLTKYMRQHQGEWMDKRKDGKVEGKLPGVVFDWQPDSRIV